MNKFPLQYLLAVVCGVWAHSSFAHDPGLSTATIQSAPEHVQAVLTFALKDVEQLLASVRDPSQPRQGVLPGRDEKTLQSLLAEEFQLKVDDRKISVKGSTCHTDGDGNISVHLKWDPVPAGSTEVHAEFLRRMPLGHRQYLVLQSLENKSSAEWMLSADLDSAKFPVTVSSPKSDWVSGGRSISNFLAMGIRHILTGYDHLLFLFALLIVSHRLLPALKIITSFTVAHSLALALATMNVLPLPGRFVEPLIAASIVYVGIENLFRGDQIRGRWMLAFAFGLIHGCGFASGLRDLGVGVDGRGIILPLLSFNLGVELGQMAIAAAALPLLWQLRNRPIVIRHLVPGTSVTVILLGTFWFVQRVWF